MTTGKPRRWFQLHLSTCVALMFVAGAYMWVNTWNAQEIWCPDHHGRSNWVVSYEFGWPFIIHEGMEIYPMARKPIQLEHMANLRINSVYFTPRVKPEYIDLYRISIGFNGEWVWRGLIGNAVVLLVSLCIIAFVCEFMIRSRARAVLT